jgi:hypothetical protein
MLRDGHLGWVRGIVMRLGREKNKPLYVLHKKCREEVQKFFEIVKPCIKHP